MSSTLSKPLENNDQCGFEFAQEMLGGDPTYAINFDRIQKHPTLGYLIFEYLRCGENQQVTPYTSHPNKYFKMNKKKFISLFQIATDLGATLYLINYARKGSKYENMIKIMKVKMVDENDRNTPVKTIDENTTREDFSKWFRKINKECAW